MEKNYPSWRKQVKAHFAFFLLIWLQMSPLAEVTIETSAGRREGNAEKRPDTLASGVHPLSPAGMRPQPPTPLSPAPPR